MKAVNKERDYMKEYTIKINTEKDLENSENKKCSELDLVLQVYQDLTRLSQKSFLSHEDNLIKKVLEQILETEFNKVEDIPVPEYYKD